MTLKNVEKNLNTGKIITTPEKLNNYAVSIKKVADFPEFRAAAVYKSQKTGELFTYNVYKIIKPLGTTRYTIIHPLGYHQYTKMRQEAVDIVIEKVMEDYDYMINEKLQQIEDTVYFKRLAQK